MSDEKRREELKAKINEQLDKLSIEDLEKIAGGIGGFGFPDVEKPAYCMNCKTSFVGYRAGETCPSCGGRLSRGF